MVAAVGKGGRVLSFLMSRFTWVICTAAQRVVFLTTRSYVISYITLDAIRHTTQLSMPATIVFTIDKFGFGNNCVSPRGYCVATPSQELNVIRHPESTCLLWDLSGRGWIWRSINLPNVGQRQIIFDADVIRNRTWWWNTGLCDIQHQSAETLTWDCNNAVLWYVPFIATLARNALSIGSKCFARGINLQFPPLRLLNSAGGL